MVKLGSASLNLLGATLLLVTASCSTPVQGGQKSVAIEAVGWVHQNISPQYWTANKPKATQFLDLTVEYSGTNLALADFDSLKVTSPGGAVRWKVPITSTNLDPATKTVSVSLWNSTFSANGSVMETGDYQVQLVLKNGESAPFTRSVPPPGSATASGPGYAYSEEFAGTKTALHLPTLRRPILVSEEKTSLGVSLRFQSKDPILFGGRAYFYDKDGVSVARSSPFVSHGTGIVASNVNGGAGFYNKGETNIVTLTPSQLMYTNQGTFANIASYVVTLNDGMQYMGTPYTYDSQSWGDRVTFGPTLEPDGTGWADFRAVENSLLEKVFLYPVTGSYQSVLTEASVSFKNLSGSPYFGILFCYQNKENHYRYRAETGGGSYSLEKVVGGLVTRTSSGSTGAIEGGINTLSVKQTAPGVFQILVNNSALTHTLTDSTFSGGESGYYLSPGWSMPTGGYHTKVQMTLPLTNP